MTSEESPWGQGSAPPAPSQALAAPDQEAALRHAALLWAEANTRPETLDRRAKLRDKSVAVTSFFDFAGKHPGEVTPEDVSLWRQEMEARGLKPATVYARIVAEETGSFMEAQETLDHENQATAEVYVQSITIKADRHGHKIAKRIRLRRSDSVGWNWALYDS